MMYKLSNFKLSEKEACLPVIDRMIECARLIQSTTIQTPEQWVKKHDDGFMTFMFLLVREGISPALVKDIVETLINADDYTGFELLKRLIVLEGVLLAQAGENLQTIRIKLTAMLGEQFLIRKRYFELDGFGIAKAIDETHEAIISIGELGGKKKKLQEIEESLQNRRKEQKEKLEALVQLGKLTQEECNQLIQATEIIDEATDEMNSETRILEEKYMQSFEEKLEQQGFTYEEQLLILYEKANYYGLDPFYFDGIMENKLILNELSDIHKSDKEYVEKLFQQGEATQEEADRLIQMLHIMREMENDMVEEIIPLRMKYEQKIEQQEEILNSIVSTKTNRI